MKKRYLLAITGLLFAQLPVAWGQTEIKNISAAEVLVGADGVKTDTVAPNEQGLAVSECEKRAQFVKDAVARKKVRKSFAEDRMLKKRVNVLETKCDSLDTKVTGISTKLKESQKAPVSEAIQQPYIIQVCVLTNPMKEPALNGKPLFMDRVNGYYRYSITYETLEEAQKELPGLRKLFSDAFIRKVK